LGPGAATLQRFDGSTWHDVDRFRSMHDANAALDLAIGEGEAPGALRIVEAPRSMGVRVLIVVGAVAGLAIAAGIIWLFVAGT